MIEQIKINELNSKSKDELIEIINNLFSQLKSIKQGETTPDGEESKNKLNKIISNNLINFINLAEDIICIKDGKGRWLLANQSDLKLFHLENVDYFGKTDLELAEYTNPIFQDAFRTCNVTDEKTWTEGKICRNDEIIPTITGEKLVYDVIKQPTFNKDGSRNSLIVIGRNVTKERQVQEIERILNRQNRLLKDLAIKLLELDSEAAIYDEVTKTIAEITNSSFVSSTVYENDTSVLKLQSVFPKNLVSLVLNQFPHILDNLAINTSPEYKYNAINLYKNLYTLPFDLYELTFHKLPQYFCNFFNKISKFKNSYTIGYIYDDEIYGYLTILLKENEELQNSEFIETIVTLASESIKRLRIYGELLKSKNQLEISNLSKEKYFSVLANDLESTFKSIIKQTEYLTQNYSNIPFLELKREFSKFDKSLNRASLLLENIFEWSKIEMGKIEIQISKLTLMELFELNREFLIKEATQKNIDLIYKINNNLIVNIDARLIEIVIRNIVYNAIKFSYPGGKVKITSKELEKLIEIIIEDNGCGIEEENLPNIFNRNIKFTTLGTSGEEGTGLGLLVAKTFVEYHNNCTLEISSIPKKGTTVKFTLPKV